MRRARTIIVAAIVGSLMLVGSGAGWLALSAPPVYRLELATDLVDATSTAGRQLLTNATAKVDYDQLAPEFVPQSRRAFCGVATSVTVLNALTRRQPSLDQQTLFTPRVAAVQSELAVSMRGLTLEQLAEVIAAHGAHTTAIHAAQSSPEAFREALRATLSEPDTFLVVNYDRKALQQDGGGHISPVAAYNADMDTVLVLDVAAHKYPHTWVPLERLWDAMNTQDSMSEKTRGYLLIRSRADGGAAAD